MYGDENVGAQQLEPTGPEAILARAESGLAALCTAHGIDDSHGIKHANAVLAHASEAVRAASPPLTEDRSLAVRLAALLHDADDHKYFGKESSKIMANASKIMWEAKAPEKVIADSLVMISLVSCSANGNSCPPEAMAEPSLLWPRWADRLEASGEIGVVRCYLHNRRAGAPLSCESTPRPRSEVEAYELASEQRFADYQVRGGSSASFLDHFYDKLLQVARPPPELVRNSYLEAEAKNRVAPLLTICLEYGQTGKVPVSHIEALATRLGIGIE